MNRFLLFLSVLLGFASCFNPKPNTEQQNTHTDFHDFEIKYAKGFSIYTKADSRYLLIHNPENGLTLDSLLLSESNLNQYRYFNRIIAQSTTHFAFLNKIQALKQLVGLCGLQYLEAHQKSALLNTNEICNAQGLDIEKVVGHKPDLVFLYPFGDKDKPVFQKFGFQTVYLTEYLENSPLARAEWLKFFALITGQNPNEIGFEALEKEYLALVQEKRPTQGLALTKDMENEIMSFESKFQLPKPNTVAFNLPFGDVWDMPSGNSISAQLVKDAGLSYFLDTQKQSGNLSFKLEEAYNHLHGAHYWVIIAARPENYSLLDLLAENRIYETFAAVHLNTVIFCNTETTPYFSEGPTEPQLLLRDLIRCIEGDDSNNKYFFLLK
jgi:iron complex transport system substrate-binding protein